MKHALSSLILLAASCTPAASEPTLGAYLGYWSFTTPEGRAGWLGFTQSDGKLDGEILWESGSVIPLGGAYLREGVLHAIRVDGGYVYRSYPELRRVNAFPIEARADSDSLHCTMFASGGAKGTPIESTFTAKRIPPLPPAPNLSELAFGDPIPLIAKDSLEGWAPLETDKDNAWSVNDGVLFNDAVQPADGTKKRYANLRTLRDFDDFQLSTEVLVDAGGNSGIYLRGVYEVQVADTHNQAPHMFGMGGIYSRIAPTENAELPPGQWQHFDITLADRHVTVVLNGVKIIDNQPLLGVTGGALWGDGTRPGPLYLQGDHTSVKYRNMTLRPRL